MNKNKLKSYAPTARREFIRAVTDRAHLLGLSEDHIEPAEQRGDVTMIGGRAFKKEIFGQRKQLEQRIKREGFQPVMEAAAYTWFNRFTALRYMELHGYLGHGFRVLSNPAGSPIPEILEQAAHVNLSGLSHDQVIELKLDGTRDAELYRMLLVAQCNQLNAAMPFLFERINDETELLLPDNLLHSDSLIRKLVTEIDEVDWQEVEIIGWLYQFYISEKKAEVIGTVVKSEDIPAATQLFTPKWIVKYLVENSLGRQWLTTYPNSALRGKMEYYIEPAEQTEEVQAQLAAITPGEIDPETITVLDPACGSGHILVEAYDVLKEIYQERGYRQRDIPRLILEKNLFGLDIDDRAAQLAGFALLMKARADDRRILDGEKIRMNVMAIQSSNARNADEIAAALLREMSHRLVGENELFPDARRQQALAVKQTAAVTREDIAVLLETFKQAKTFGSLITIPDELAGKLDAIAQLVEENLRAGDLIARSSAESLFPIIQQAEMLARKYDCVTANPPYMGSKGMNTELKAFAAQRFPMSKSDLFSMFIQRAFSIVNSAGFNSMISMESWMFLSSFERFRKTLLSEKTIISLIHMPYEGRGRTSLGINFGTAASIFRNIKVHEYEAHFSYVRYTDIDDEGVPFIFPVENSRLGNVKVENFQRIPGSPLAYWLSDQARLSFERGVSLSSINKAMTGMRTGDNERFLRYWFEVPLIKIGIGLNKNEAMNSRYKWFPYNKGGEFCKWYGNNLYIVNWENDGYEIKALTKLNYPELGDNLSWKITNESLYFSDGITWGGFTIASVSFRWSDTGALFDSNKGAMVFPSNENRWLILGFLSTKLVHYLLKVLNPTLSTQNADIDALPFDRQMISERKREIESVVSECVRIARSDWNSSETSWGFQSFPMLFSDIKASTVEDSFNNWQAQCTANIKRMQELETENNRLFIEAYGLEDELTPEVPEDQITLARTDREADIECLISYAVGCFMGRYSLDQSGLVYAHSGNVGFDQSLYKIFPADADGIVPVLDMEWFSDDAANRFVEFLRVAWPAETLEENLKFVAGSLSPKQGESPRDTIRRYLSTQFYKDHLQTYKRRPIYWLFSSGKHRAFECLVYLHRYNEATLSRMRNEYVTPLFGKIAAQIDYLGGDTGEKGEIGASTSTAERNKLRRQLDTLRKKQAELAAFDDLLRHYADQKIALDLDDGVKVNYAKLGKLLAESKAVTGASE